MSELPILPSPGAAGPMDMSTEDRADLSRAMQLLASTGFVARVANAVGQPVEKLLAMLPTQLTGVVLAGVNTALERALDVAVLSLGTHKFLRTETSHKIVVAATGALGGAFGFPALFVELPASTTVMLRSIATIAQHEGEVLEHPSARLACLEVFALGGPNKGNDAADAGYFATRAAMAKALEEAAEYVATHGVTGRGAPVLVRFLAQIAPRFGVPVSEKVFAQSVPIVGALGGVAINLLFLDYFQDLARGHFIIRRLERKYGPEEVREMSRKALIGI